MLNRKQVKIIQYLTHSVNLIDGGKFANVSLFNGI